MGVDFITTFAKSFEKSWDRNLAILAQPSLFTEIRKGLRTYLVVPCEGCAIRNGRWYEVVIGDDKVTLVDGLNTVGVFCDLPQSQIDLIRSGPGSIATAYAHRIMEHSGVAEVTVG